MNGARRRLVAATMLGAAAGLGGFLRLASATAATPATKSDRRHHVSTTSGFPRRYEAIYHDDKAEEHAGVLAMAADGKLEIAQADPRFAEMLGTIVHNMNTMPHETIRVPPKPDEPRRSLHSRVVPRSSAEFVPTMLANIRRGYRLELRTMDAP